MQFKAPEGTRDLLPEELRFWEHFKARAAEIFSLYGYTLIETPLFEQTEVFARGIGEATDVVSKEMFSVVSPQNLNRIATGETLKSKSRLSLRPEGTAGVVRAVIQHDLVPLAAPPVKLMYAGPMFRAERPQKGRQRQFNQVGIECIGADDAAIDAEAIVMLMRFFADIGISPDSCSLLVNSMGCEKCRPAYREAVAAYMDAHADGLCADCHTRTHTNPLRAFDCKLEGCKEVMALAPRIEDYLCADCKRHFDELKSYLESAGLAYRIDSRLVRGLDYYNRTVFEVQVNEGLGSQNAIGGGGRYDGLVAELGGRPCSGFGFALGFERCFLALQAQGLKLEKAAVCRVFIAAVDEIARKTAFSVAASLRDAGISCDFDHQKRSLKSQFKLADRLNARYVIVIGSEELESGLLTIRDMQNSTQLQMGLGQALTVFADSLL